MAALHGAERAFSITEGGPFDQLVRRLHLVRPSGLVRVWWLVAIAWGPLALGALLRVLAGRAVDPIFRDISVHTRFLVGLPLLFAATQLLEPQCRGAVDQLYLGQLADRAALDRVIDRAERLRSSAVIEAALVAIAIAIGLATLWEVTGPTGVFAGIERTSWSFSRVWYAAVSLPLLQFLMLRWLWRWAVWIYVLAGVSRLPLAATATHPDRAAGLGFLAWPLGGFTWFVFAFATVLAGAWATQLLEHRATVPMPAPTAVAVFVIAVAVGCGPLLLFCAPIYRIKRRDLAAYTLFNLDYVRQFRTKWIDAPSPGSALGSSDIQSLNDTLGAFQMILTTRLLVFSPLKLKNLVLAVLVPMLPLALTLVPIETLLNRIGAAALGVLPF